MHKKVWNNFPKILGNFMNHKEVVKHCGGTDRDHT